LLSDPIQSELEESRLRGMPLRRVTVQLHTYVPYLLFIVTETHFFVS
jgi:hypothetical protein